MTEGIITGLIGVAGGAIVAWISLRRYPSRITTDAISLVDAGGKVRANLTEEIERLEGRQEELYGQLDRCNRRCDLLERTLRDEGIPVPQLGG